MLLSLAEAPADPVTDESPAPSATVCVPSTINPASLARLSLAPETVMAGPPGASVCVPNRKSEAAFALRVEPEYVRTGRAFEPVETAAASGMVEVPM